MWGQAHSRRTPDGGGVCSRQGVVRRVLQDTVCAARRSGCVLEGAGWGRGCVEREPLTSEMLHPSPYQGSWDLALGESRKAF